MDLRDAVRGLVDAQYDGKSTEQGRDALRAQANRLYDNFVKKYGYFNKEEVKQYGGSERISRPNQAIIEDYDGDVFLVSSIEEYNKSTGKAKKAPLLERDILLLFKVFWGIPHLTFCLFRVLLQEPADRNSLTLSVSYGRSDRTEVSAE